MTDPGSGLEIGRFLEKIPAGPPIVIHTTNRRAGDSMESVLRESGWSVRRVVPCGYVDWVREIWARSMRNAIVETIPAPLVAPQTIPAD